MGMPEIKKSGISRYDAITDIIESIALEEAALAHILNAEGEKIQKAVKEGKIEDALKVNESVNMIIQNISGLQTVLTKKLSYFENCLCEQEVGL